MSVQTSAAGKPVLAVFDLDGTLTWHDTLVPYLWGYALRHPRRWWRLWRLPVAALSYVAGGRDRGVLKARVIQVVLGGLKRAAVDAWSERYVANLEHRGVFRPAALATLEVHRAAGDRLVLLSASPDLYVPRIGRMLGFERTICTEVAWCRGEDQVERLQGELRSANRRGEEKSRVLDALRVAYPHLRVVAYGNSDSDIAHMLRADHAVLVNGDAAARRAAAAAGIAIADWT